MPSGRGKNRGAAAWSCSPARLQLSAVNSAVTEPVCVCEPRLHSKQILSLICVLTE